MLIYPSSRSNFLIKLQLNFSISPSPREESPNLVNFPYKNPSKTSKSPPPREEPPNLVIFPYKTPIEFCPSIFVDFESPGRSEGSISDPQNDQN